MIIADEILDEDIWIKGVREIIRDAKKKIELFPENDTYKKTEESMQNLLKNYRKLKGFVLPTKSENDEFIYLGKENQLIH